MIGSDEHSFQNIIVYKDTRTHVKALIIILCVQDSRYTRQDVDRLICRASWHIIIMLRSCLLLRT